jgi:hypothetical protein
MVYGSRANYPLVLGFEPEAICHMFRVLKSSDPDDFFVGYTPTR